MLPPADHPHLSQETHEGREDHRLFQEGREDHLLYREGLCRRTKNPLDPKVG